MGDVHGSLVEGVCGVVYCEHRHFAKETKSTVCCVTFILLCHICTLESHLQV